MTATATQQERANNATPDAQKHSEGIVARTIEEQTAKLPSDIFLWAALGSIGISLYFELKGEAHKSSFVSRWVSPFLLFGVYNKLVKKSGSDRVHRSPETLEQEKEYENAKVKSERKNRE